MSLKPTRMLLALGMVFATLLSVASPASALNEYPVSGEMHFGRIDLETVFFGTVIFDTPGSGVGECEGATIVDATFDDRDRSIEVDRVQIKAPFTLPTFGGTWQLEANDVPAERTRGEWDHEDSGIFDGVREELEFSIQTFNETGCVKGDVVCTGDLDVEIFGTTRFGDEGPIPGPYGPVWVEMTTERRITVDEGCESPWSFLLPGADVRLEENPNPDGNPGAPGAEFRFPPI